ncbi:Argininosuccinate lyase [archaeon HR04]|uniref:Argininosuccinate lyase n=1 Tax=uncultured Candidatus Nitrosocaldus sp. TaxID=766501 RepID=Q1ER98_9ARCH|nr:argininosuccinate lyase [uncultured Candidatus Nitrosocaldus sp.]GBC73318.1 Argininosuccinate lyase [archaeon HR04]
MGILKINLVYRSRLKGSLDEHVLAYLSSMDEDTSLLPYDIVGSEAHSIMLYEQGLINKDELARILEALESAKGISADELRSMKERYEDVHEALEAYVIGKAGIDAGGKMHTARSRNDQVTLDLRMKVRDDITAIEYAILEVVDALLARAKECIDAVMPMYTHLQHAQIGSFSHYLLAYVDMLLRDVDRLESCYARVNLSPLGSSAIGGTSLQVNRDRVANLLGFNGIVENSIDATSSRDFLLEFCSCLCITMLDLSRMAEDMVLWSSSEFNYIELSDELASTSSVMPQKKNPCPLELMRARASTVLGLLASIMGIVRSLPSGYSRDLQESKRIAFDVFKIVYESLLIMRQVVSGIIVKRKDMLNAAEKSYAIAVDVAEELVKRRGIAFRVAHRLVGAIVAYANSHDKNLRDLSMDDLKAALDPFRIDKDSMDMVEAISSIVRDSDPLTSLRRRSSKGSPNPSEQERMIHDREVRSKEYRAEIDARQKELEHALASLQETVNRFLGKVELS